MSFILYRHTNDGVFDNFPKISDHRPRIFQNSSEGQKDVPENVRRLPKTFEENPKMIGTYTNEFKCNLTENVDISEIIDIFTSEDVENAQLESWM